MASAMQYPGSHPGNSRCPEWSPKDVVEMMALNIKIAGVVAFLAMSYLIGALTVSGLVQDNLRNYKSDYI